jgi:hypothetical protein
MVDLLSGNMKSHSPFDTSGRTDGLGVNCLFSVRGERFDFAHRPEQVEGVSNHERNAWPWFFANASSVEADETVPLRT